MGEVVKGVPENSSVVMPRLFCRDVAAEIDFCKAVFGVSRMRRTRYFRTETIAETASRRNSYSSSSSSSGGRVFRDEHEDDGPKQSHVFSSSGRKCRRVRRRRALWAHGYYLGGGDKAKSSVPYPG